MVVGTRRGRFALVVSAEPQISLANILAVAECAERATLHDGDLVGCGEDADAVGDDDHHRIGRLQSLDGLKQHALADMVQAGIGLVENHQARVAKKCPCKAEVLAKWALLSGPRALDDVTGVLVLRDGRVLMNLDAATEEDAA